MWTIFCDDVRQELGGKLSYMGIYGPQLIVPSYPAMLQKVCAAMTVRVMASHPPESVLFRLLRNDDVIYEHAVDDSALQAMAGSIPAAGLDGRYIAVGAVAQIVNVELAKRGFLRARAIVDGEELRGGSLEMLAAEIV